MNNRSSSKTTIRKMPSQAEQVMNHLTAKGSINTVEAINKYGVYRLGAVIHNLKSKGADIETSTHEIKGKNGKKSLVAKYIMA